MNQIKILFNKIVGLILPQSNISNNSNSVETNLKSILAYMDSLDSCEQDIKTDEIKKHHFRLISEYLFLLKSIELKFRAKNKKISQAKQKHFTDAFLNLQHAKKVKKTKPYLEEARNNFLTILLLSEEYKDFNSIDSKTIISEIFNYDSADFNPQNSVSVLAIYLGWATCKSLLAEFE